MKILIKNITVFKVGEIEFQSPLPELDKPEAEALLQFMEGMDDTMTASEIVKKIKEQFNFEDSSK